jgi:hypothetical protein
MLVYFSANARDIEQDIEIYRKIIDAVRAEGGIMAQNWIEAAAAMKNFPDDAEWWRSMCEDVQEALNDSDRMIIEATGSSTLGVGFELAQALANKKPTLALVRRNTKGSYVGGLRHPSLEVLEYDDNNLVDIVQSFILAGVKLRMSIFRQIIGTLSGACLFIG